MRLPAVSCCQCFARTVLVVGMGASGIDVLHLPYVHGRYPSDLKLVVGHGDKRL